MTARTIEARATRAADVLPFARPQDAAADAAVEVEVSFSSEVPYQRWRWNEEAMAAEPFLEVLGHGAGEVDLSVLTRAGAPVLKDHINSVDAQVGTVVRAWVENGRGRAILRFGRNGPGEALAARVLGGEVVNISVGYNIEAAREDGMSEGVPIVRVTRWVPHEISWVAVPADPSVGYRRSADAAPLTIPVSPVPPVSRVEESGMTDPVTTPATPQSDIRSNLPDGPTAAIAEALRAERARVADIESVASRLSLPDDLVRRARDGGLSVDEFNRAALDHLASADATRARESRAAIGMTEKDKDKFRFFRLLAALIPNADRETVRAAGHEIEVCRAAAQAKRNTRSDFTIPADVLDDPRYFARAASANSQITSSPTDGGALVPTDYRGGSFIEALRNGMSITQAGATVLQGLQGPVDIPKQTGVSTASWIGEGADVSGSKPTTGLVTMSPHTLAIKTEFTRRMLLQADPSVEMFLRGDMVMSAALEIDKVALKGSAAAAAPNGLADYVPGTTWTTASTITRNQLIDMKTAIKTANAAGGSISFIFNAVTAGAMEKINLDTGSGRFLYEGGKLVDLPAAESNQAADYDVFLGDWRQFLIGFWSGLDIQVDPYTLADSNGHLLRAFQDVDFQVRHTGAFAYKHN